MAQERIVELDGPVNFRDVGGYKTFDGQSVKWGKVYRSDALSGLSEGDQTKLTQLKVVVDCDLRSHYEQAIAPDVIWPKAKYVEAPIYSEDNGNHKKSMLFRLRHRLPNLKDNFIGKIYQDSLLNSHTQKMFSRVFEELLNLDSTEALVYHCSAGKDRTGMVTALVLMGLGVSDDTIARDYLLTNELYNFSVSRQLPSTNDLTKLVAKMNVTKGEGLAIRGITETIRACWGGFAEFFTAELGFSISDLELLRHLYLEEK